MEETTIYIPTKLTDKVLEGLPKNKQYCIRFKDGCMDIVNSSALKAVYRDLDKSTRLLLPIKLTTDMLQKEAEKRWAGKLGTNKEERDCIYMGFCECFYWLLNLNKEGENG